MDIFGEDYENERQDGGAHSSSPSSSPSSASSSDGRSSSSPRRSASSGKEQEEEVIGVEENGDEDVEINSRDFHSYQEEDRELFGSDNEDYCKTTAILVLSLLLVTFLSWVFRIFWFYFGFEAFPSAGFFVSMTASL